MFNLVTVATVTYILCALRWSRKHACFHSDPGPRIFKQATLREAINTKGASYLNFVVDVGADLDVCVGVPINDFVDVILRVQ